MAIRHKEDSLSAMRQGRPTALEAKLAELGAACEAAIFAGVDVETAAGSEHFSLTLNDQTNLGNLALQAQAGAAVLYHADGELCRTFAPDEILAVVAASTRHKTYHTTLCNHLNVWARRTEDEAELAAITYESPLPPDLAANMAALFAGGGE
jgi:hypothetical protein